MDEVGGNEVAAEGGVLDHGGQEVLVRDHDVLGVLAVLWHEARVLHEPPGDGRGHRQPLRPDVPVCECNFAKRWCSILFHRIAANHGTEITQEQQEQKGC